MNQKPCTFCTLVYFQFINAVFKIPEQCGLWLLTKLKIKAKSLITSMSPREGNTAWCPGQEMDTVLHSHPFL